MLILPNFIIEFLTIFSKYFHISILLVTIQNLYHQAILAINFARKIHITYAQTWPLTCQELPYHILHKLNSNIRSDSASCHPSILITPAQTSWKSRTPNQLCLLLSISLLPVEQSNLNSVVRPFDRRQIGTSRKGRDRLGSVHGCVASGASSWSSIRSDPRMDLGHSAGSGPLNRPGRERTHLHHSLIEKSRKGRRRTTVHVSHTETHKNSRTFIEAFRILNFRDD